MFCRYRGDAFLVCKIIVTGAKGQLGTELVKMIKSGQSELGQLDDFYKNVQVIAADLSDLDICDAQSVYEFIKNARPYAVVNCAAMTDVDGCETNSAQAFKINALGPRNLAVACENFGAKLVQLSMFLMAAKNLHMLKRILWLREVCMEPVKISVSNMSKIFQISGLFSGLRGFMDMKAIILSKP